MQAFQARIKRRIMKIVSKKTRQRLYSGRGCYTAPTWGQTHGLQAAVHDDRILLWHRKDHSNLHGPINRTDDIGLGLRDVTGSLVSQYRFFMHDARGIY